MSGNFEETIKSYVNAIIEVHHKYKTKKYHDKALDITNDMLTIIFNVFAQLNPEEMEALNAMELAEITDEVCAQYSKKTRTTKKAVKTVNVYTGIFTPIVRGIVEPILKQWDEEEPNIRYNRITSINSIASKIYKNLTDKSKYTDTYEYQSSFVDGKNKGTIVATVTNPENADKIIAEYSGVIDQILEDKKDIEASLDEIPDEQLKEAKSEFIQNYLNDHAEVYNNIRNYVVEFTNNYKEALRDMCIDKPIKSKKPNVTEELVLEDNPIVTAPTKKTTTPKKTTAPKKTTTISPPVFKNIIDTSAFTIPPFDEIAERVEEEEKPVKTPTTKRAPKRNVGKAKK